MPVRMWSGLSSLKAMSIARRPSEATLMYGRRPRLLGYVDGR